MSVEAAPAPRSRVFTPLAVAAMVIVGVVTFLAYFGLSAFAPEMRSGRDGGSHALSYAATGFAALPALLQAGGEKATVLRVEMERVSEGLLVVTPAQHHRAENFAKAAGGAVLIVLPKWIVAPRLDHPGWVYKAMPAPEAAIAKNTLSAYDSKAKVARRRGKTRPLLRGPDGRPLAHAASTIEAFQTLEGPNWTPIVVDEQGRTVLGQLKRNQIYVLSDPDLLNNQGLKELGAARNAATLLALAKAEVGGDYFFDVSLHGYAGQRNLLKLALTPPFLPATICALIAALAMGVAAAARFGPTRRAERAFALGPEALADNSAGLIRLARREHRMAPRYAALVRQTVARAVGAPRDLEGEALSAFLDRLPKGRTSEPFSSLQAEADRAANVGDLMRVARKLYDWKREMMRVGH